MNLKTSLHIRSDDHSHIIAELGWHHVSFLFLRAQTITGIASYYFSGESEKEKIHSTVQLLEDFLADKPGHVFFNYHEAAFIPNHFFNEAHAKDILQLQFGPVADANFLNDRRGDKTIVYAIPTAVHQLIKDKSLPIRHSYSCADEKIDVQLVFYHKHFKLMIHNNGILQCIQQFHFDTQVDVSYYTLQACANFGFNPEATTLHVTGMIEEQSPLYAELSKYFSAIRCKTLIGYTGGEAVADYPLHLFEPLISLYQCVL